jgi:hypothetical protein
MKRKKTARFVNEPVPQSAVYSERVSLQMGVYEGGAKTSAGINLCNPGGNQSPATDRLRCQKRLFNVVPSA